MAPRDRLLTPALAAALILTQLHDGRWDGRAHRAWGWLTDAEGRFTLDPIPPGSFELVVDELDPASGGWTKDYFGRIPLQPGGTLRRDFVIPLRLE